MSEANKDVIRTLIERVFNQHDPVAAVGLVADDVIDHSGFPGQTPGLEGMQQRWAALFAAFPDIEVVIDDLLADGDFVVQRATGRATHKGGFFGVAPTGRRVEFKEINISRFEGGKTVEHWAQRNDLGVMMQLGAMGGA